MTDEDIGRLQAMYNGLDSTLVMLKGQTESILINANYVFEQYNEDTQEVKEVKKILGNIESDISNLFSLKDRVKILRKIGVGKPWIQGLFNPSFMRQYTVFDSFEGFLDVVNADYENRSLAEIPEEELNAVAWEHTKFNSWAHMLKIATEDYLEDDA